MLEMKYLDKLDTLDHFSWQRATSVGTSSSAPPLFASVSHGFVKPLKASEYVIVLCRYVCEDRYGGIITQERSGVKH